MDRKTITLPFKTTTKPANAPGANPAPSKPGAALWHLAAIAAACILSTLLVWAPFLLSWNSVGPIPLSQTGQQVLDRYWDGPLYVVAAATLYAPQSPVYSFYGLSPQYYAAHLAAYPLVIRALSFAGWFNAMLIATLLFTVAAAFAFYFFARDFGLSKEPLLLSLAFAIFPPRWLVYHSVGASEPLFIAATIACFYFYRKNNFLLAGIAGAAASATRIFGILLFLALAADLLSKNVFFNIFNRQEPKNSISRPLARAWPLLLIPAALLLNFAYYAYSFGNFFAYFSVNQGYLQYPLASVVEYGGAIPGELMALLFAAYAFGVLRLFEKKQFDIAVFCLLLFTFVLFLGHNDVSRYLLPAFPFAILIGFEELFSSKNFRPVLAFLAAASIVYAWTVLPTNLMPLQNYDALLSLLPK